MDEKTVPGVRKREQEIAELEKRVADPNDPYNGEDAEDGRGAE